MRYCATCAQSCVATACEAVEKVARAPVSRFQAGGSAADDVHVQLHLHAADVHAPRANAVVVAFYLDPGAVFDVDRASRVNGGLDVSVDVDKLMLTL